MNPRNEFIIDILTKTIHATERSNRLDRGLKIRKQIADLIKNKEIPNDIPRFKWLNKKTNEITNSLLDIAKQFDEENPIDKASIDDLIDISYSAFLTLKEMKESGFIYPEDVKLDDVESDLEGADVITDKDI